MTWPAGWVGTGPLAGVRVLDLSRVLAGPWATMQLADLGADVIKVERPGHGDETRHWGPPFTREGDSTYFLAANRNKRSVALDLSDADDARVARDWLREADVVVDNFMPGKLEALGFGYERLCADHPGLVSATISGFGRDNPYADRPGFDLLAQAMGGLMSVTGEPGGRPLRVGVAISDLLAGLYLTIGVLAALSERDRTGRGKHIDVALLDVQVATLANLASGWLSAGHEPVRVGNRHASIVPYQTFEARDSTFVVAVGTDRQFVALASALGRTDLAEDPRYATNALRSSHLSVLGEELDAAFATRDRAEWLDLLQAAGVPVAPVNTVSEVFEDPVIRERMVEHVGGVPQVRSPLRIDGEPLRLHSPPPGLGEHQYLTQS